MQYCFEHDCFKVLMRDEIYRCPLHEIAAGRAVLIVEDPFKYPQTGRRPYARMKERVLKNV